MKQKLDLISPLTLPPPIIAPKKPWEKKLDRFLSILLQSEMEKEKRKETEKNQSFGFRLISWFWYLFVLIGFYFLLVDPVVLVLMIVFIIFMAYIRNLASKCFQLDQVTLAPVIHSPCPGHTLVTHTLTNELVKAYS